MLLLFVVFEPGVWEELARGKNVKPMSEEKKKLLKDGSKGGGGIPRKKMKNADGC